jgi:peptidoglycan/xylan/chitin deacetylase (PgdA/CDA1 family)
VVKAIQFHRITPEFQFCGTWNYPGQFEKFIHYIRDNVEVILPGEAPNGVVVTFDDGDKSVYQYAFPVLRKYGVRAVVFLVVDYIGQTDAWDMTLSGKRSMHLSWDQIHEMQDWGIWFGSHTLTHRNLTILRSDEIIHELTESKRILEQKLGGISCISYPFNRTNREVILHTQRAGYRFGFGGSGENDLLIKKEAVYITDNVRSLATKLSERPRLLYQYDRIKQKTINYFTMATMLTKHRTGDSCT